MKRLQIDLPESVIETLRAQATQEGRKLKPYLEYILTENAKKAGKEATTRAQTTQDQPAQLTPNEVAALRALLSLLNLSKGLQ